MLYFEPPSFSKSKNRVRVSCIDRLMSRVRRFQQVRRQLLFLILSNKLFLRLFFERKRIFSRQNPLLSATFKKYSDKKKLKISKNKKLHCVACLRVCAWKYVLRSVTLSLSISLTQFFFLKFSQNNKLVRTC